jgi:pimeloyl-ACP methyl ester carboxylesterase
MKAYDFGKDLASANKPSKVDKAACRVLFQPPIPPAYLISQVTTVIVSGTGSMIPVYFKKVNLEELPTIVYSHGNAEDLQDSMIISDLFSARFNANVLAYDYTGYGWSFQTDELFPSEMTINNDIHAVVHYALSEGVPLEQIVLYGWSLGGAAALHAASSFNESSKFRGLILESTFSSLDNVSFTASSIYRMAKFSSNLVNLFSSSTHGVNSKIDDNTVVQHIVLRPGEKITDWFRNSEMIGKVQVHLFLLHLFFKFLFP